MSLAEIYEKLTEDFDILIKENIPDYAEDA
jgi:hypothetical protein